MQTKLLIVLLFSICLTACSLKDPKSIGGGLIISLVDRPSNTEEMNLAQALTQGPDFGILSNPTSSADFNCFAVNVTGAGIIPKIDDLQNCTSTDNMHGHGFGILSNLKQRNQTINVDVPSGAQRTISVYGVYPTTNIPECGGTGTGNNSGSGYYLGETTMDLFAPSSITIGISYSGANSNITCSGNGTGTNYPTISSVFPDGGISGTSVTIKGSNLNNASSVDIIQGTTAQGTCSINSITSTQVTCTVGAAGLTSGTTYGVRVNFSDGQTATISSAYYFTSGGAYVSIDTDTAVTNFGSLSTGATLDHTVTVMNTGNSTASSLAGTFTPSTPFTNSGGTYPGTGGTCGGSLAAATSCTVVIRFSPTSAGAQSSTYSLGGNTRVFNGTGI